MLRTGGSNSSPMEFFIMKVLICQLRPEVAQSEALHDIRVLHRDMKSANVFLSLGLLNESICITPSTL